MPSVLLLGKVGTCLCYIFELSEEVSTCFCYVFCGNDRWLILHFNQFSERESTVCKRGDGTRNLLNANVNDYKM